MVNYYLIVTAVNILFLVFYFSKLNTTSLSHKTLILITSLSLLLSFISPLFYSYLNGSKTVLIILLFITVGGFFISKNTDDKIDTIDPLFNDNSYIVQEIEKCFEETSISQEPLLEAIPDLIAPVTKSEGGDMDLLSEEDIFTLNSYINKGFEAKFENKFDEAVGNFLKALEFPIELDLELMLIFDICTLSKEAGKYATAIDTVSRCIKKNSHVLSVTNFKELSITLKYLEYLQDMLAKVNTPNLPISKIPTIIKVSIDNKLNEWKKETFK